MTCCFISGLVLGMGSRGLQASATAEIGLDLLALRTWTISLTSRMTPCMQTNMVTAMLQERTCVTRNLTTGQHCSNV